jgi:hypothetical protein
MTWTIKEARTANSTYPKGGVSCFKDNFVVNQTFVFQIKFCGESPALRVAAKRYRQALQEGTLIQKGGLVSAR